MKEKILIVEDDPAMRLGMDHFLRMSGYQTTAVDNGLDALDLIRTEFFDLAIIDLRLPNVDGLTLLREIKGISPDTAVIIITAFAEVKTAVQAIKDGAFDYLSKPFTNEELMIVIERCLKFRRLELEVQYLKSSIAKRGEFEGLVGVSNAMQDIFQKIQIVAKTDVPVLIQGESGTGKELVADAIQKNSLRKDYPYVKINCAAIPETLFESELFGYERGAFTGATETKKGKLELAHQGTIFLDEIGEMPLGLQAKLLRVIEELKVYRLGGKDPVSVNVRFLYATCKNLRELVKAGRFREDLFYRINVVPITIPPLRERKEDIPALIEHFVELFAQKYNKPKVQISSSAYEALLCYEYPGNVRELKHAIERGVILSSDGTLDLKNLPEEIASCSKSQDCSKQVGTTLRESVEKFERELIIQALRESGWRKSEAAKRLGICRKTLWEKIKAYDIKLSGEGGI